MKLFGIIKALSLYQDLKAAIKVAFMPTLKAILREPTLLFRPLEVRRAFMAHVWTAFGGNADAWMREDKEKLVRPNASGVVFDLGAGYGHLTHYLDKERVMAYVALEPNVYMHEKLRKLARASGFVEEDGTFLLIGLSAEDIVGIQGALADWTLTHEERHRALGIQWTSIGQVQVNTIVSILSLCSVPNPERTLRALVHELLAPGGQLVFFEHVRNPRADIAFWQDVVTPVWRYFFDGCVVGVDGVGVVRAAGRTTEGDDETNEDGWATMEVWGKEGEEEDSLFWHQAGRCVKKAVE
ncbi:hypothetical protein SCHPADRAFT_943022 [Schizopora paradoxa]|uniref:S-adenosyl-L-methionine-dependent methyltransferase n=1 Tax=Schizopora paradoxa TaxID=27342 RepID=A0A0H2REF0_9AGAM|nr:hypothetical protein SCHPADRAFT_943022 [Schizopora paradoxa]